tara:strand:- start:1753 stop:1878 length:126 start_codon:yes stop_codon:yes gene_type:complete
MSPTLMATGLKTEVVYYESQQEQSAIDAVGIHICGFSLMQK